MNAVAVLHRKLIQAEAVLQNLRAKADDAMICVARQRIEVEKLKAELEKFQTPPPEYRPVD